MILLIDNYDSFTYNLYQYLCELGARVEVARNDEVTVDQVRALSPDGLVISPGPCTPREAGVSLELIRRFGDRLPILGVCLGHQCIGEAFGGRVVRADELYHGKTSLIHHDGRGVFRGVPSPFRAIRYHSLVVAADSVPDCLEITARTDRGLVMGLRHRSFPVEGVQFHPESIMTEHGKTILKNFLSLCEGGNYDTGSHC
jgi:anthranilate synthase/aminodeoxychorismate synthase-like glutamine amidotransferase